MQGERANRTVHVPASPWWWRTRRSSSPLQRPGWGRSHPFEASVPLTPQLLPFLGAISHWEPGDCDRTKARAGSLTSAATRSRGLRAPRPVGQAPWELNGLRAPRWRPCAAASGRQTGADRAGGQQRGSLDWESSKRCNFHALICMSFAWSSGNGPATQPPRPLRLGLQRLTWSRLSLPEMVPGPS